LKVWEPRVGVRVRRQAEQINQPLPRIFHFAAPPLPFLCVSPESVVLLNDIGHAMFSADVCSLTAVALTVE